MKRVNTLQDREVLLKSKFIGYGLWTLVLILVVTLTGSINRMTIVKKEIQARKMAISKIESENRELERKIIEAQSQEYIEKEIRNKLGLAKEGEVVVVLPDVDTLRKIAPEFTDEDLKPDPNWKKWMMLFM